MDFADFYQQFSNTNLRPNKLTKCVLARHPAMLPLRRCRSNFTALSPNPSNQKKHQEFICKSISVVYNCFYESNLRNSFFAKGKSVPQRPPFAPQGAITTLHTQSVSVFILKSWNLCAKQRIIALLILQIKIWRTKNDSHRK